MTTEQTGPTPIACDMTGAPDTAEERLAEYGRLFAQALIGRDRTERTVQLRFRAGPGIQEWVADLAAREKACCPFYDFTISTAADQVRWEIRVVDGVEENQARAALDAFYQAPAAGTDQGR
jgi:hypothetical protein